MRERILSALLTIAACVLGFDVRIYFPLPYVLKLRVLNGWQSRGLGSVNCSGLITAAHGSEFLESYEIYQGKGVRLVTSLPSVYAIDERILEPGDIAAFEGTDPRYPKGVHVAAYLGRGRWIDSDSRRGYATTYSMSEKKANDPWFAGSVRIARF